MVVVVWPTGSKLSGSTPMAMRSVSVPTLAGAAAAAAGAAVGAPAELWVATAAGADAPFAGAVVGLGALDGAQAASNTTPPAPSAALRKDRRFNRWAASATGLSLSSM